LLAKTLWQKAANPAGHRGKVWVLSQTG